MWLGVKNPPANAGDTGDSGSIPGWGRFPGGEHGNPFQYSCQENPMDRGAWQVIVHGVENSMDRGAWQVIVHGVANSKTQLSTHKHTKNKLCS